MEFRWKIVLHTKRCRKSGKKFSIFELNWNCQYYYSIFKQTHYPQIWKIIFLYVSRYYAHICIILHFKISYVCVIIVRSLEVNWYIMLIAGEYISTHHKKAETSFLCILLICENYACWLVCQSFQHFWLKRARCGIWIGLLSKLREIRRLSVREDWMVLDTVSMSSLSIHKHEYVRLWSTVTPFFRRSDIRWSDLALNRKILKQLCGTVNKLANSINCSLGD